MAVVRTEYDYAIGPHLKLFFDLKDKNYKKAKMKGGLGWMGNDSSLFNGNHFSSLTTYHSSTYDVVMSFKIDI